MVAFLAGMTGILGRREIGMAGILGRTGMAWHAAGWDIRDFREERDRDGRDFRENRDGVACRGLGYQGFEGEQGWRGMPQAGI